MSHPLQDLPPRSGRALEATLEAAIDKWTAGDEAMFAPARPGRAARGQGRPARNILVAGRADFRGSWNDAFVWNGFQPQLLENYNQLQRHLAPRRYIPGDLLTIDAEIISPASTGLRDLVANSPRLLVVMVASFMTVSNWQFLGDTNFMIVPPSSNEVAHRLVARSLLDLGARSRPAVLAESTPVAATFAGGVSVDFDARQLRAPSGDQLLGRGEAALLRYLVSALGRWRSTADISRDVFQRTDPAGRSLVWKYASTLRLKLGEEGRLLQQSRSLGYRLAEEDVVAARLAAEES